MFKPSNLNHETSPAKKKQGFFAIGTVLIHLNMALKQDHGLGREYCKQMKTGPISTGSLSLLVSLSASAGYDSHVMDVFKSVIVSEQKKIDSRKILNLVLGIYSMLKFSTICKRH